MTVSISLALVLVALALWWLSRPPKPSLNEPLVPEMLRGLIDILLFQGLDGGELHVVTRNGPVGFRLIKYVRDVDGAGMRCEVSKAEGGKAFDRLLEELSVRGISHQLQPPPSEGVHIDLRRDIGQAQFVTVIFFERCHGVRLASDCVAYFNDKVLMINAPTLTGITRPRGSKEPS